jgi:protoporphyrinogen oxidase
MPQLVRGQSHLERKPLADGRGSKTPHASLVSALLLSDSNHANVVILGAGPAGLTAAYELSRMGVHCTVLERDSVPGGLARTVDYKGYLFDLGGHRFYTKVPLIERIWFDVLGEDFLTRPRLSRIFYRSKFFQYPLDPLDVIHGLGPFEVLKCALSSLKSHIAPQKPEDNLAAWISNRFGNRLFEMFFKSYTEKVWGVSCSELSAEWAAQRIRGLSFQSIVLDALKLRPKHACRNPIKTLIREFHYPRRGPGMLWAKVQEIVEERGSKVIFDAPVERILWRDGSIRAVESGNRRFEGTHFIGTLPIRDFVSLLDPAPPPNLRNAALDFHYRDFITVGLIVRGANLFADNWIYIHEPAVKVGRVQNYTNWSPEMSPDPNTTSLGMEYFCFEGDTLWSMKDEDLLALAGRELAALKLVRPEDILDGTVIRVPKAYPIYDNNHRQGLQTVRQFLETVPNLQFAGRNGMHRYNNQDHSMLTALMAAQNIVGGNFDAWRLEGDSEYLEEGGALDDECIRALEASQPRTPYRKSVHAQV